MKPPAPVMQMRSFAAGQYGWAPAGSRAALRQPPETDQGGKRAP